MMDIQKLVDEVNRHMARRQRLDVRALHARLDALYPGAFSLETGDAARGEDFEILCGLSPAGRLEIFDNGLDIVFGVEGSDGSYFHWHPADAEAVVTDVIRLMVGK